MPLSNGDVFVVDDDDITGLVIAFIGWLLGFCSFVVGNVHKSVARRRASKY